MKPYVWRNKEKRAERAQAHYLEMEKKYPNEIKHSIQNSIIYEPDWNLPEEDNNGNTLYDYKDGIYKIIIDNITTSEAIAKYSNTGKTAALNFASFKNPGGMFLNGSRAQEECLCHDSILYNVLKEFQESYYTINKKMLNNALYESRILYSPDIVFDFDYNKQNVVTKVDIITSAAPNAGAFCRYHKGSKEMINAAMIDRVSKIFTIAAEHNIHNLILGAFGCGVFENDPKDVASIFKKCIDTEHSLFKDINFIFAIPSTDNNTYIDNYNIFKNVLES
ncbi:MAG: TIGR02452 family protein [Acholeplasmatales bacterium]|nr:TIGR02452 family protein [Acholeplasmatales bacterium]